MQAEASDLADLFSVQAEAGIFFGIDLGVKVRRGGAIQFLWKDDFNTVCGARSRFSPHSLGPSFNRSFDTQLLIDYERNRVNLVKIEKFELSVLPTL